MTSFRQIEANRRNARKSTGPRSEEGKQHSRCNAVRHGLTAETVIGTLEDAEDYKAFEAAVTAGFDAETAVERKLVLRLASLLWRLRRATANDTDFLRLKTSDLHSWVNIPPRKEFRVVTNVILFLVCLIAHNEKNGIFLTKSLRGPHIRWQQQSDVAAIEKK
jgi:hypothetical protein